MAEMNLELLGTSPCKSNALFSLLRGGGDRPGGRGGGWEWRGATREGAWSGRRPGAVAATLWTFPEGQEWLLRCRLFLTRAEASCGVLEAGGSSWLSASPHCIVSEAGCLARESSRPE